MSAMRVDARVREERFAGGLLVVATLEQYRSRSGKKGHGSSRRRTCRSRSSGGPSFERTCAHAGRVRVRMPNKPVQEGLACHSRGSAWLGAAWTRRTSRSTCPVHVGAVHSTIRPSLSLRFHVAPNLLRRSSDSACKMARGAATTVPSVRPT